jgi:hypothetical protein
MKFSLTIDLQNDAFVPDVRNHLAQLLQLTAERVSEGLIAAPIRDLNGNRVGSFEVSK